MECANIGREGAFGVFAAIYSRVSFNQCVVQLQGPMSRCPIEPFDATLDRCCRDPWGQRAAVSRDTCRCPLLRCGHDALVDEVSAAPGHRLGGHSPGRRAAAPVSS